MTTREQATFILFTGLLVFSLLHKNIRVSAVGTIRQLFGLKIGIPFLVYIGLVAALALFVDRLGYWNTSLIGGTILWFLFTGFKYFLQLSDAGKKEHFFRERLIEVVSFGAFLEFFLNIRTFSLPVELVMQIVLAFLVMLQVVARSKSEFKSAALLVGAVLGGVVTWLVISTILNLVHH